MGARVEIVKLIKNTSQNQSGINYDAHIVFTLKSCFTHIEIVTNGKPRDRQSYLPQLVLCITIRLGKCA